MSTSVWGFFYGGLINPQVLDRVGMKPSRQQLATLAGFDLRISPYVNLVRSPGHTVFGLLMEVTHAELQRTYSQLKAVYLPQAVVAVDAEGRLHPMLARVGEGRSKVYVAEDGPNVVAFLSCELREDILDQDPLYLCITDLVVVAGLRRQGIARALIATAESFARENGARTLTVTALSSNPSAQRAYERLGFQEGAVTFERPVV